MSRVQRNRANLAAFAAVLAALSILVAVRGAPGAGAAASGELVVQPALGAPARIFLGPAPLEAPGAVWATAKKTDGQDTLAGYTDAQGWEVLSPPAPNDSGTASIVFGEGASVGRTTAAGGIVVAATHEVSEESREVLVVRDPGGQPRQAADPMPVLEAGFEEGLYGRVGNAYLLAASDEAGGRTGAYVVPESLQRVLHYDGSGWSSEVVCLEGKPACEPVSAAFEAVAIDAAGGEAWLLGRGAAAGDGLELFRRESDGGEPVWRQQPLGPADTLGARLAQEEPGGAGVIVRPRRQGPALTATSAGVWIDATLNDGSDHDATAYYDVGKGEVTASWCDLGAALCSFPLGAELAAGDGRSFAWPTGSSFGTRAITGVGAGAILSLEGTVFRRLTSAGGDAGASRGAALSSPKEGWLGAIPPLQLTRNPQASALQSWPVPFRRPLTAIAAEPGETIGAIGAEALAVGDGGQVARYIPGLGWEAEFLLRASGKRATPTLRGVAWPEPGLAYAVGDNAAMWRWQKATGLWQPDPGASANLARANFTAIAFDPAKPSRGYAVGKQGLLLGFGREWAQEPLPLEVPPEANFSSVAFAGGEAIATWKFPKDASRYLGGVIVNDGSGWKVDGAAQAALGGAIPQRVAGLPDGGAAIATLGSSEAGIATPGRVITRQGLGGAWQVAAGEQIGYPAALSAVREGNQVRAVVSVSVPGPAELGTDTEQVENQPPPGQAPLLTSPYPLPASGSLLRQTANGWRDEQRQQFPLPLRQADQSVYDLPVRGDPILALLIAPDGSGGWAVGGETASNVSFLASQVRTAAVLRYGAGAAAAPPANAATVPIESEAEAATFVLGGHAQCAAACADLGGAGIGPDRWLPNAVNRAAGVGGVRAFLYTGASVAANDGNPNSEASLAESISATGFQREQEAYARRLGAGAGGLPVFAAASQSDRDAADSLSAFQAAFGSFSQPFGAGPAATGITPASFTAPGKAYYSFDSSGKGGIVRVIVLDYSSSTLGDPQRCWLAQELGDARGLNRPAIVVGERDLAGLAPNAAADRTQVVQTLVGLASGCAVSGPPGAASAYFFDFPEENRAYRLNSGGRSLSTFGSGTLGYVRPPASNETDFAGASGFILASVEVDQRDPATNVAPVAVKLAPSIGSLALDATDGTLLRRSQVALFEGLARRSLGGPRCEGASAPSACEIQSPPPYVPIPSKCQGGNCSTSLFPEYTFTSSEPDIADFVAADPASTNPRNVLLVKKKPVLDAHSGLLCAFNAGTTIVTVSTGGLSYTQKVTVQAGTVQQPCGTTPLRNRSGVSGEPAAPPAPAPTPNGAPLPNDTPPPPPPPPGVQATVPTPAKITPPVPPPPAPVFLLAPTPPLTPLVPIVPPPPLPAPAPTPPSGTSQVVEEEEEQEEAIESSSAFSSLPAPGPAEVSLQRRGSDVGGVPPLLPVAALVAAVAAAGLGSGRRRQRPRPAFQTTNPNRRYR